MPPCTMPKQAWPGWSPKAVRDRSAQRSDSCMARAASCLAYLAVDGPVLFAAVAAFGGAAGASGGARNALVCGLTTEEERMRVLGAIRSLNHIGWAAGAAVGALIIGIDTRPGYAAPATRRPTSSMTPGLDGSSWSVRVTSGCRCSAVRSPSRANTSVRDIQSLCYRRLFHSTSQLREYTHGSEG